MITTYALEIYESRRPHEVLAVFEFEAPFLAFHPGDLVNTAMFHASSGTGELLRVLAVEHLLWETNETTLTHKLCVFTEAAENTPSLRMTRAYDTAVPIRRESSHLTMLSGIRERDGTLADRSNWVGVGAARRGARYRVRGGRRCIL